MIGLLQRVRKAHVEVSGEVVGSIQQGLMALIGVQRGDAETQAERLVDRLLGYRIFTDDAGKMNHSVVDIDGGVLLVPQFTLAAETRKGMRPSFTPAAEPATGKRLFQHLVESARARYPRVGTGHFGEDMQVSLVNDGPVTFWLEVPPEL
ncbi:MAG: D-aminoacyl-tRNA deacylase [Gammaproteobacteria bacterium]